MRMRARAACASLGARSGAGVGAVAMAQKGENRWRRCLSALARRLRGGQDRDEAPPHLRKPYVKRGWRYTSLQFDRDDAQSRMLTFRPDELLVDYTRTMMAALLFRPDPARIGIIGLGGGSQPKFCYRHLPGASIEVAEINPHVIALRRRFRVPDDDGRFRVVQADGARFVREHRGCFDVLLVDAYDETGIPAALSTQAYYDDCRDSLAPDGVMATNLYCDDADRHVARLRASFGSRVLVVEEPRMSNRVAFAWVGDPLPPGRRWDLLRPDERLPEAARRQLDPVFARVGKALQARRDAIR